MDNSGGNRQVKQTDGREWILSSVATFFTLGVFYLAFGFYFESSEPWVASILYGNLTASPHGIWFTDNHFLQIPALAYVASLFPRVPVYGLWHGAWMSLYVWLWFFLGMRVARRRIQSKVWALMCTVPFIGAILGTSLVNVYFMRGSILLASVSLLLYLDYYLLGKKKPVFILFFLLACGMRVSSGLMVLGLVTLLALLCIPKKTEVLKAFWKPWLLVLVCMVSIVSYKTYSSNRGAKIDQVIEYALLDRGAINPISMAHTAQDTMRYRAVTEHFLISDSAQITVDFVKGLVDQEKLNVMGISRDDAVHFAEALAPWLDTHKWVLIFLYAVLFAWAYGQSGQILRRLFILHLSAWGVIALIGLKISTYPYFLEPWLAMLFGMSGFLLLGNGGRPLLGWQKGLTVIFAVLACACLWPVLSAKSAEEKDKNMQGEVNRRYLSGLAQNSLPIIWVNVMDYPSLPSDIFSRNETDVFRKCENFCIYFWGDYPFAQERCLERLGFSPSDWRGMHNGLYTHRNEVCFLMTERLATFLPDYYRLLYGLEFDLKRDFTKPEIMQGVYVYKL